MIVEKLELGVLWDEYGLVGDVVVSLNFFYILYDICAAPSPLMLLVMQQLDPRCVALTPQHPVSPRRNAGLRRTWCCGHRTFTSAGT